MGAHTGERIVNTYQIEWTETVTRRCTVRAASKEEAFAMVKMGEYDFDDVVVFGPRIIQCIETVATTTN